MDNQNKKLLSDLILLRKEVERLNDRKKIPVINYIGRLEHQESVSGELSLKSSRSGMFHFFVDFKENGIKSGDRSLILSIKNENTKEINEEVIYKENNSNQQPNGFNFGNPSPIPQFNFGFGGFGFAGGGGTELGSKNLNLLFSKSVFEGKNKISVKNFLGCEIQTLYLIAEI